MTKIVGVRFKPSGKMYYFDPLDYEIRHGMHVIVETSRGVEYGEVTMGVNEVSDNTIVKPLKGVMRIATEEDTARHNENKKKEKEAFRICREKVKEHGLDMKLIDVEYSFDGSKILFYFTADGRVDFRDLVKDLASVFRTRIELRQIGVRDESKTMGSVGMCGRNLCCSEFLSEFVPVSVRMAKDQGLALNPTKISGVCGRLMCCLKYEQDNYEALMKEYPKNGEEVNTPDGKGKVVSSALLRGKVKVRFDSEDSTSQKEYDITEINGNSKPEPEQMLSEMLDAEKPKRKRQRRRMKTEKTAEPAPDKPQAEPEKDKKAVQLKQKNRRFSRGRGGKRKTGNQKNSSQQTELP
ncbi:MAG: stage 0 sporulation family protein [Clostridia bacterium]|nr:stage 0 sporulation family protein [Clostridia bacterium]